MKHLIFLLLLSGSVTGQTPCQSCFQFTVEGTSNRDMLTTLGKQRITGPIRFLLIDGVTAELEYATDSMPDSIYGCNFPGGIGPMKTVIKPWRLTDSASACHHIFVEEVTDKYKWPEYSVVCVKCFKQEKRERPNENYFPNGFLSDTSIHHIIPL